MTFLDVFHRLLAAHGPQGWWPADTPFEVMVGAVLTQNTAWTNVEKAIANLGAAEALSPEAIADMDASALGELIRPSGYFNVKAQRLQSFCRWYLAEGGFDALARRPTDALRRDLLSVHGIGPETADDILLYAFGRPVFVVDAYTRRLFGRLGLLEEGLGYEEVRATLEQALSDQPHRVELFGEYHALIVAHAKVACRKRPACSDCGLTVECPGAES